MGTISVSLPTDGTTADVADYNTPINTIVNVINGNIDNANVKSGAAIATSKLAADNGITGAMLSTSAICLGYAQITANVTSTSGAGAQLTGLTVTVTIPAGGRKIKITVYSLGLYNSVSASSYGLSLWDGAVVAGTQLQSAQFNNATGAATAYNMTTPATMIAVATPAAGSKTYNVGGFTNSGTVTVQAGANNPAFILVEAI